MTHGHSTATDIRNEVTATPPESPEQARHQSSPIPQTSQELSSPPSDTQAFSQFVYPPRAFAEEVEDEDVEGVWGYLIPLDDKVNGAFILKKRDGCAERDDIVKEKPGKTSKSRKAGVSRTTGGYLIGRHPECGQFNLVL